MLMSVVFDVIVVGGGHAGIEACFSSAKIGANTLLITQNTLFIGNLSCNPSIGGVGKSHLVSELSSFGALMPLAAKFSHTHFKILNASKGYSVQSSRYQVDRRIYSFFIKKMLYSQSNLTIIDGFVDVVLFKKKRLKELRTKDGRVFFSCSVVFTVGTFLNTSIFPQEIYKQKQQLNSNLSNCLESFGLFRSRFKTGTPPRLYKETVNFNYLLYQLHTPKNMKLFFFDFFDKKFLKKSYCYTTYTNSVTHQIIRDNLQKAFFFLSNEKAVGPRYCPSIEDKVIKFPNKNEHQIFLEFESGNSDCVYPSGLSTSLPVSVQLEFLQTIKGFENVVMKQAGYTVEYDYFDPRCLTKYLSINGYDGIFLAGQINGTTGYEEAAAQGLVAGINAALFFLNKSTWVPDRSVSYLGVLIDDLVNKGVSEPYRMFTSNVENRLHLFEETVYLNFFSQSFLLKLLSFSLYKKNFVLQKYIKIYFNRLNYFLVKNKSFFLKKMFLHVSNKKNFFYYKCVKNYCTLMDYLKLYKIFYLQINLFFYLTYFDLSILSYCEFDFTCTTSNFYINEMHVKLQKYKKANLSFITDYRNISGLSIEICEKLNKIRPYNFEQIFKISGINTVSLFLILFYWKNYLNGKLQ